MPAWPGHSLMPRLQVPQASRRSTLPMRWSARPLAMGRLLLYSEGSVTFTTAKRLISSGEKMPNSTWETSSRAAAAGALFTMAAERGRVRARTRRRGEG